MDKNRNHKHGVGSFIIPVSGLVSGLVQAGLFNPWDRALYLSVRDNRRFLKKENFVSPFRGFWQAVVQRTISGGLYFVLQDIVKLIFFKHFPESHPLGASLAIGCTAGALNGMILNQLAVVKYHAWNDRDGLSFPHAAMQLYQRGGLAAFFKGMWITGIRDTIFGCTYEVTRHGIRHVFTSQMKEHYFGVSGFFFSNLVAGSFATVISGPANFVRSIKYATPAHLPAQSSTQILRDLWHEVLLGATYFQRVRYIQHRLKIGWGTARVGCGMAVGQQLFDHTKSFLESLN